jgi:hypothetical protein
VRTLAVDIGGTKFTVAVFEGDRMAKRESRSTDREGGRDWMLAQIREIASGWKREAPLDRCGIGFGGPVDFEARRVALSTHVGGWRDFALPAWVESELGLPVVMDNDANVGALGEAVYGAGKRFSPLFYMTLSTGVGGGLVADGAIYRGADSYAQMMYERLRLMRELLKERDDGHFLGLTQQLLADVDHAFRLARAEQRLDLIGELRPRRLVPLRDPGPTYQKELVLLRLGERLEVRRRLPDRDS